MILNQSMLRRMEHNLIMGNEGQGMSDDLLSQTTDNLYIPMRGEAESLNVAISAGILMFQLNQNLD